MSYQVMSRVRYYIDLVCQFSLIYTAFDNISLGFSVRILLLLDDENNFHELLFQNDSKITLERISEKFILCSSWQEHLRAAC
jgi:hypothetical protein